MEKSLKIEYFLGANTPKGFISLYDSLINLQECRHLYIIKGGPGSGKSTLMKRIANKALECEYETHFVRCSGDPSSLDAVYIPSLKIAIVDGTAPHVIDPKYPGAIDSIVDMSACWNSKALEMQRNEIVETNKAYKTCYDIAYRYLAAAGKVEADMYSAVISGVDFTKLNTYCDKFIKKQGLETKSITVKPVKRFISSPTCEGMYDFKKSLACYAKNVVIIKDYCNIGNLLIETLRDLAVSKGIDCDEYYGGMSLKYGPEALHFKEKELAVILSTAHSPFEIEGIRGVRVLRFINPRLIELEHKRIHTDKRMELSLMEQAQVSLDEAKNLHDKLEKHYISAMNFERVNEIAFRLEREIFS